MQGQRRRRTIFAIVAAGAVIVVVAGVVFTPWRLFVDTEVRDADPFAATTASPDGATGTTATPAAPTAAPDDAGPATTTTTIEAAPIRVGTFRSIAHPTSGTVRVGPTPDGRQVVFLEGLATDNGPDVRVFLSPHPPEGDDSIYGADELELGPLKGNVGDQTYEVPAGTDLARYQSVVLWCERFSVGFGVAGLTLA